MLNTPSGAAVMTGLRAGRSGFSFLQYSQIDYGAHLAISPVGTLVLHGGGAARA